MYMIRKEKQLLLSVLFLLFQLAAKPQSQSYLFSRLNVEDGLRSNYVTAIFQDTKGFMWIGTEGGLQRYDGKQFEYFPFEGIPEIYHEKVQRILEGKNNTLWIAYNSCVVTYNYVTGKARKILVLHQHIEKNFQATQFFIDSRGNTWLCTTDHGTFLYEEKALAFIHFSKFFAPAGFNIVNVAEDPVTHNYWLGTNIGICMLDYAQKICYTPQNNPRNLPLLNIPQLQVNVARLFGSSKRGLFINTWPRNAERPRFYHYDLQTGMLTEQHKDQGHMSQLIEDNRGNIWAAGDRLLRFTPDGHQLEIFERNQFARNGLDYSEMFTLAEDNMQNLWIGTSNGLFIFNYAKQQFHTVIYWPESYKHSPPLLEATDIWQHPNGDVWVSSWGYGVLVFDSSITRLKKRLFHPSNTTINMAFCMLPLPDGKVLIGAQHANLWIVDPKTWKVEYRIMKELDNRSIRCMTLDKQGKVWLGTQRGIVAKWDFQNNNIRTFTDSFYTQGRYLWNHIQDIHADDDNFIWVGTMYNGLLKMDTAGHIVQRYAADERAHLLPASDIRNIFPMGDHKLLIAAGGIVLLDTKKDKVLSAITQEDGLPVGAITNVQPLNDQNILFTTNFSAGKANLTKRKVVHYGRKYGIADETFESPASYKLQDGRVVLGSTKNIIFFEPDSLQDPVPPPDVRIHYFKTDGDLVTPYQPMMENIDPEINLRYQDCNFTIGYISLAYLEQDNLSYSYRLEGIDNGWIKAGNRRYVTYTNLAPGTYTFQVYCENGEGMQSQHITSIRIVLASPIWQKGWFYGLIILLIAGIIYLIHRIRVNRIMSTEKVRRRIARDLHDDMGSTLTSINIMSAMARRNAALADLSKTQEFLVKIGDSTTRMMESMDDIVWSINPMNDNLQRVIARMREFTTGVLEGRQIAFTFSIDDKIFNRRLQLESRHDFFMIYKEAITNIAKYAQCTFVDIRIQLRKGKLVLRVQDNGVGFDVNDANEGDGLMNMQRRAHRMKGHLNIQSQPGKGTVITLMFPTT